MEPGLVFKVISLWTVGFFAMALVVLLLCSARKENDTGAPIAGMIQLAALIAGLCTIIALSVVYVDRRAIVLRNNVSLSR